MDINSTVENVIGTHEEPIRCVVHAKQTGKSAVQFASQHLDSIMTPATGQIITGSWDKHVGVWDPRSNASLGKYAQPAKVFSMDIVNYTLVVAMAGRSLYIYDIRNMKETLQQRESSLKYMTRVVRCMPNGEGTVYCHWTEIEPDIHALLPGFASGSIEGRIAVEFFDPSPDSQTRKYAFKCHREKIDNVDHIYAVNALAFHPRYLVAELISFLIAHISHALF